MPSMGNPNSAANGFRKIQMRKPTAPNSNRKKEVGLGDELNNLAGIEAESKFVDRKKHNTIGKDGFLKLLSHQLQNQDPHKPMDQKQFSADLAQFSQLEQLTNMNKKMDNTQKNLPSENKFFGASFLGKEVTTSGTSIKYDGESSRVNLPFFLPKDAKNVTIRVFDKSNNLIQQIDKEGMGSGSNSVTWDGTSMDGYKSTGGEYRFDISAYDTKMRQFKGQTRAKGKVTGVNFENGETVLTVDNKNKIFLRDVVSFQLPEMTKSAKKLPGLNKAAQAAYNGNTAEQTQQ